MLLLYCFENTNIQTLCTMIYFSPYRMNTDDTMPNLIDMKHCQTKHDNVIIPPYGMAFWHLKGLKIDGVCKHK